MTKDDAFVELMASMEEFRALFPDKETEKRLEAERDAKADAYWRSRSPEEIEKEMELEGSENAMKWDELELSYLPPLY